MTIKVVHSEIQIATKVKAIAKKVAAQHYQNLVLLTVLRGGVFFGADLARALWRQHVAIELDFMSVSIYDTDGAAHVPQVKLKYGCDMRERDVLVVDDSYGTGVTFQLIRNMLRADGARTIHSAVIHNLVDRVENRLTHPEYALFETKEKAYFRVGYGEDVDERLREMPYIGDLPEGWQTLERYK